MQLADPVAVVFLFSDIQLFFERPKASVAVDRIVDRAAVERRRLLRDMGDAPVRRELGVALVGVDLAAQQREEARLARAVGADQADTLTRMEGNVRALEERLGAPPERELREADQLRTALPGRSRAPRAPGGR
jgi:hypothetical protein